MFLLKIPNKSFLILLLLIAQNSFSQIDKGWVISTPKTKSYAGITVANGRIGVLPSKEPFKINSIILNNVFEKESELGVSKIVAAPQFMDLKVYVDGELITYNNVSSWKQSLNMKNASFTTTFKYKNKVKVSYTYYALRNLQYVVLNDVKIESLKSVEVSVFGGISSSNEFKNEINSFKILKDLDARMPILQTVAKTKFNKHTVAVSSTFIFQNDAPKLQHIKKSQKEHEVSFKVKLKKNQQYNFTLVGAACTTQNFKDPQSESERFVIYTLLNNKDELIKKHKKEWGNLWKSDIVIEGDLESQLDVRLALYHLYSFAREDSDLSISPMGLSSKGYNGHVFWDTELWMYPPLLLLNQNIAKSTLNYRFNRLTQAKERAINYGFKGAMFPWESDETGEEATPTWALTGTFEHHITADIGIAFWNYYRVTKDLFWLKEKGYPMLSEIAKFWVSRSVKNKDGSYSINNVIGANEFAPNVNDNAFTNGAAKTVLMFANDARKELGLEKNEEWNDVSDNLKILKFKEGITKEHSQYNGEIIKQVDVNLLAFPLEIVKNQDDIKKDLKYYESKIYVEGPAMSHSILAVLYARLGEPDKAFELFKKAYLPNKREPFGALSESATSNNPYFATGAGGMLQTVLFGFGGLHITNDGIIQKNPILPSNWKSLTLKNIGVENQIYYIKN
jgi:trehalose/maltose hydrolase-like predicted phosphorylase